MDITPTPPAPWFLWAGGGRPGSRGLHKLCAGFCVIQQHLELGAHVEVAPVDGDPGAPCLGAHGRLQGVDQGQLWGGRQVVRPWASPWVCAWWGGQDGGLRPLLPHRRSAPVTCPPWRRSPSPRLRMPLGLALWRTQSWGRDLWSGEQPADPGEPGRHCPISPLNNAPTVP